MCVGLSILPFVAGIALALISTGKMGSAGIFDTLLCETVALSEAFMDDTHIFSWTFHDVAAFADARILMNDVVAIGSVDSFVETTVLFEFSIAFMVTLIECVSDCPLFVVFHS